MLSQSVQWLIHKRTDPGKYIITSRCGNPKCVSPAHLKAITSVENGRRCARKENGTLRRKLCIQAAAQKRGKLTPDLVREIRASDEPCTRIAARLGVHQSTVNNARNGHTWRESGPFAQMLRLGA